jgi:signal transduction histidine kinase
MSTTILSNPFRLTERIGRYPIRRKLMVIAMVTTAAALLLAGVGIVAVDSFLYRTYLERDLATLAQITADNSTAALAFEDPAAASEILHALRARRHLVAACIYRVNGTVLAAYNRPGSGGSCPAMNNQITIHFDGGWFGSSLPAPRSVTVTRPVMLRNRRIGDLTMLYDLGEIYERMRLYGATVLLVLVASIIIAFLLSSRLRNLIATPLAQLVETTSAVSSTGDYSIRARKLSGDELGVLVDAFNGMLRRIQTRDLELTQALSERGDALRESRIARDELAKLNADLAQSNEKLARSNEDLERFAFVASHDLQEPLRMITLFSQLLARTWASPAPQGGGRDEYVRNIVASAKRMRDLLTDLLAYTDIGAPDGTATQPVDLNQTLRKVLENLQAAIQESGAIVTADPLPALRAHEGHFVSIFQNLIANALKYRSEKPPEIHVSFERRNGLLRFSVTDNGIGIDPEYHARIFLAFKRLHGRSIAGTGIGLAICQRVVSRYRGKIWVESEAGQGAAFIFTLPEELSATQQEETGQ